MTLPSSGDSRRGEPEPDDSLQVLVVAYGPPANLSRAIGGLEGSYPVLVVDNSSSAATREVTEFAGAQYVDAGGNLGFAAGVNLGLSGLRSEHADVLLLNPDAQIAPRDIERLRSELREAPDVACVAPSHRDPETSKCVGPWWPWESPARAWAEAVGIHPGHAAKGFLSGAVLLVRGAALTDVGPFDERFFLYFEDQDWQRRAISRGWQLRHCQAATATHAAGGTDSDNIRLQVRLHASLERYMRKWHGPLGWEIYRAGVLFGQTGRLFVYSLTRRRPAARRAAARLIRLYLKGPDRTALRTGAVPGR